jgi:hypothetical protein
MSKIKDIQSAKIGLSGLLGNPTQTPDNAGGLSPLEDTPLNSKEEIESTLEEETREALQREIQRRQYLKAGRPPRGSKPKSPEYVRMTFLISPEKQERLREIALRKGLFLKEILDRGIDLVLEEYAREEREIEERGWTLHDKEDRL